MTPHEEKRARYLVALLSLGIHPRDADRLTYAEFEAICDYIDSKQG